MGHIKARENYCLGCKLCEIHCLVAHSRSKKILKCFTNEKDEITSRILVEDTGHISFAVQCRHCTEAPCIESCISGAMHYEQKTGAVLCDTNRCVGCLMCVMVCPAGAVLRSRKGTVVSKCDLCLESGIPACVENCPNEALYYEED
ncbi:4Fe-4S dicluster domain-containing protein [Candidatus Sumerlaeota bacterium]|nr:4Fe-4S dicluster domain-containing protein [Candidatus Sumerlaeota bacterium]